MQVVAGGIVLVVVLIVGNVILVYIVVTVVSVDLLLSDELMRTQVALTHQSPPVHASTMVFRMVERQ